MKYSKRILNNNNMRGSMLVELLLSMALIMVIIPFVAQYQKRAVVRAQNIVIAHEMSDVRDALERYIAQNRERLLTTIGRNITRVNISELADFGLSPDVIENGADKYQLRILKSSENMGRATLQGVIVMTRDDITPLRTRQIVELGGGQTGFIDGNRAYGNFGAWRADTVNMGINATDGIIQTTGINRDNARYLWRIPSDDASDATMQVALNMGDHDILNASFFNVNGARFDEVLNTGVVATRDLIFENRTSVGNTFDTTNATVFGILSSDSKSMEISGALNLADTGKFSSFTTNDLWVTNLTLSGLSIASDDEPAVLKINRSLDMTVGRINAMYITVGYTGSVTPRLVVHDRIEDSSNPEFYWDAAAGTAYLGDVTLVELNRIAALVVRDAGKAANNTTAAQIFGAVVSNKNATAADYMNAISEIERNVRAKYRRLNLE